MDLIDSFTITEVPLNPIKQILIKMHTNVQFAFFKRLQSLDTCVYLFKGDQQLCLHFVESHSISCQLRKYIFVYSKIKFLFLLNSSYSRERVFSNITIMVCQILTI